MPACRRGGPRRSGRPGVARARRPRRRRRAAGCATRSSRGDARAHARRALDPLGTQLGLRDRARASPVRAPADRRRRRRTSCTATRRTTSRASRSTTASPILYGCGDLLTDYEGIRGNEAYRGDLGLLYLVTLEDARALAPARDDPDAHASVPDHPGRAPGDPVARDHARAGRAKRSGPPWSSKDRA